ncbi:peptidoglycan/LPS O-acetylase OafA/YrhL [Duganella sp. 1411]|uniref:acyltransferase family protein n=1 Tax=Duganella sp. 1411 TaxID=2806572 RepID=UPI001AE69983|nr:peptidoglycan/LPS O-acetylase OafA/YrhL [Duganella sp. 1411]
MNRAFSIYLDLVRVLAALAVIVYHSNFRLLTTEKLPFSNHGHAAVIVFFVLSGYVIAYITSERENTPVSYWSSRLSRFYSLALPVVLLTPLLDLAGEALAPQFYTGGTTTYGLAWLRILTSLTFLNEVWLVSIMSFSNVPYWSLCYEFWYYVLFAIVTFTAGRTRVLLAGAVMLLLGPKILLLAPAWVAGVVLFRWQWLRALKPLPGALLFAASWPAYWLFHQYGLTEVGSGWLLKLVGPHLHQQMAFSKFFMTDYLLALIVVANFAGMRALADVAARPLRAIEPVIRPLAAYTFSAYILHQPLMQFYAALIDGDPGRPWFYAGTMLATFATIAVLGSMTEQQRHHWRHGIRKLLARLFDRRDRQVVAPAAGAPHG